MSRAAGTLITTHNANYIPPRFMPGYRGHCPTIKFDYGETFGNATQKYFQDYRSEVLNSSASPYCKGGSFPTYYTHDPDSVISNRNRSWDRWTLAPRYELTNIDHDRKEELYRFNELAQSHREYYQDKSGTKRRVDYFVLPTSNEDQFKKNHAFITRARRCSEQLWLPYLDHIARRKPILRIRHNGNTPFRTTLPPFCESHSTTGTDLKACNT
ncbi:protein FAM166C A-like isoform X2 [Gigantopelta aegis]|uniref:protein FAM166C A-like isoform X2 n=1 Tax=Gigantopelta aegis TaxID=1735272 RepID=UPI001B88E125|nr:protein FAM166C A-like isoform X2 [Gigantopelta aegis]